MRGSLRDAACKRKPLARAAVPKLGGRHNRAETEIKLRAHDLVTVSGIFAGCFRSAVRRERSAWPEGSAIDTRRATAPANNPC